MSAEIHALSGAKLDKPGEPIEPVVKALAGLLADAKQGDISSLVAGWVKPDGTICNILAHGENRQAPHLVAAACYALNRAQRNMGITEP